MDPLKANASGALQNMVGSGTVSDKAFVDRLQHVRPTELTRQQEKAVEPNMRDVLDERPRVEAPLPSEEQATPGNASTIEEAVSSGMACVRHELEEVREHFQAWVDKHSPGMLSHGEGLFSPHVDVPPSARAALASGRSPVSPGPDPHPPLNYLARFGGSAIQD